MIKQYRKKPVVIEAVQWTLNIDEIRSFTGDAVKFDFENDPMSPKVCIKTLEGVMRADPDDYIIKGVKGEFYPCKPDIFAATYEEVPQ